jgi:hypothetical protein
MKQNTQQQIKEFIDQEEFYEMIGEQVNKWLDNPSNHYKIEKAKKEGWFGSLHSNRDHKGLLGYLRINFGKQIKILNNLDNYLPVYDSRFYHFFAGDWFKNEVLRNGNITQEFVLDKHIQIFNNLTT